jgi:hypothetical protein
MSAGQAQMTSGAGAPTMHVPTSSGVVDPRIYQAARAGNLVALQQLITGLNINAQ